MRHLLLSPTKNDKAEETWNSRLYSDYYLTELWVSNEFYEYLSTFCSWLLNKHPFVGTCLIIFLLEVLIYGAVPY